MYRINWTALQVLLDWAWWVVGLPAHDMLNDTVYLLQFNEGARERDAVTGEAYVSLQMYTLLNQHTGERVELAVLDGSAFIDSYSLASMEGMDRPNIYCKTTLCAAVEGSGLRIMSGYVGHQYRRHNANLARERGRLAKRLPFEPSYRANSVGGTDILNGNGELRGWTKGRLGGGWSAFAGVDAQRAIGIFRSDAEAVDTILGALSE